MCVCVNAGPFIREACMHEKPVSNFYMPAVSRLVPGWLLVCNAIIILDHKLLKITRGFYVSLLVPVLVAILVCTGSLIVKIVYWA